MLEAVSPEDNLIPQELSPRERILLAALKLFVKQGYFNTNVPDISKLSRCSVGSIYHHFLNKEEIAACLYQQGLNEFRSTLSTAVNISSDLDSTIKGLVIAFLEFCEKNVEISRYLWLARHDEFLNSRVARPTMVGFDELGRKLTKIIKGGMRTNQIPKIKADIIWSIVFGMPLSFMTDWLEGHTSQSPSEAGPILANAAVAALHGLN